MGLEWNSPVFRVLLDASLRVVAVALASAAILFVMRIRSSHMRHRVWTGVLVAMLFMPLFVLAIPQFGVPVLPRRPAGRESRPATFPKPPSSAPHIRTEETPRPAAAGARAEPAPSSAGPKAPVEAPPMVSFTWPGAILTLYGLGVAVLLARLMAGWVAMCRLIGSSRVVCLPGGQSILESDHVFSPVTCGVIRPRVILPRDWRAWSEQKLAAILIHEQAHVERRDPLIALMAGVNRAMFWFHPVAWWLERRIVTLAEQACDDVVVASRGRSEEYVAALVEIAETVRSGGGRYVPKGLGAHGRGALRQRIDRLLRGVRPQRLPFWRKTAVALLCLVGVYAAAAGQLQKQHLDLEDAIALLHSSVAQERADAQKELERIGRLPAQRASTIAAVLTFLKGPGTEEMTWYGVVRVLGALRPADRRTPFANDSIESWALGQIGEGHVDDFTAVLLNGGADARQRAAAVLAWIEGERAEQALRRALETEKDKQVASEIEYALYRIINGRDLRDAANPQAIAARCLDDSEKDVAFGARRFMARPIRMLFLDGRSQAVDETLCYENVTDKGYDRVQPLGWWLVTRDAAGARARPIVSNSGPSGYSISDFIPSPDGRYLAVLSSAEGAPFIEIADLPSFVRDQGYDQLKTLDVWLDLFSLKGWNGDSLLVANSSFLVGLADPKMPLLSEDEQVFSWNAQTGSVVPLSAELRNPLRYYCNGLSALPDTAAYGLRLLGDPSAVPCIEAALKRHPNNEDLQAALRYLRAERSAATSNERHLAVSGEGADRRLSVFHGRGGLMEDASIALPPDIRSESIERGLKNVVWDADGRNAAVAFERPEGTFIAAFVIRKDYTTIANDISRSELSNIALIGPARVYARRSTVPVEWQERADGAGFLTVRTRAWDAAGKQFTAEDSLKFDEDTGLPIWK
jgi:hypothetical protein